MRNNLRYLWYLIRHKWYVFLAGLEYDVPIWLLIIHDWPKFTRAEWRPYVDSFYGPWRYDDRPCELEGAFDRAWLHHQRKCPHHWQHWILREDDGQTKILEMPKVYAREMIADWVGAGMAIHGRHSVTSKWYTENRDKIILGRRTRIYVETQMYTRERSRINE